jgi:hypothetical protein
MADQDMSQFMEELRAFGTDSWDFSALDGNVAPAQINDPFAGFQTIQRNIPQSAYLQVPVSVQPRSRKRRRRSSLSYSREESVLLTPTANIPGIVVYNAKGQRKDADNQSNGKNSVIHPTSSSQPKVRSTADMERAQATLSMLPGVVAVIRYECRCKSAQGTCNHRTFAAGLALPNGLICGPCRHRTDVRVRPFLGGMVQGAVPDTGPFRK